MKRRTGKILAGVLFAAAMSVPAHADAPAEVPTTQYVTTSKGSLSLSGSVYLYDYAPAMPAGENNFDLYAFILNIDAESADKKNGLHTQLRYRDTKLRSYFLSNVWFQELYAYHRTEYGDLHVGKFYRNVGLLWDDSFFGNVQYFNGLKLNPAYGVEFVGTKPLQGPWTVDYSAQFFPNNSNTGGSLPGRSVESDPLARQKNIATARVAPKWSFGDKNSLAFGVSGMRSSLQRSTSTAGNFGLSQEAADVTLTYGPSVTYVEVLNQNGERDNAEHPLGRAGYDTAVYLLAGTRWQVHPRVNARFNYSSANYVGQNAREEEFVPGLVFTVAQNMSLIAEFDYWRLLARNGGSQTLLDRSYNTVLNYRF